MTVIWQKFSYCCLHLAYELKEFKTLLPPDDLHINAASLMEVLIATSLRHHCHLHHLKHKYVIKQTALYPSSQR